MESLLHLPEELVILILERLPPVASLRFRSVCKSWRSIISGPDFLERSIIPCKRRKTSLVITEDRRHGDVGIFNEPSYTVLESPTSLSPTELEPLQRRPKRDFGYGPVVVVGSCRGVVCLVEMGSGRCILWNPTTGESRDLPDNQLEVNTWFFLNIGFGHCDGDFKVVKIYKTRFKCDEPICVRAQIYELSLGSWREIIVTGTDIKKIGQLFYFNRNLECWRDGKMCSWLEDYWEVNWENRTAECIIFSFDMADETFTDFSSVPVPYGKDGAGLLALNDLLALWCSQPVHQHPGAERTVDIWVMLQLGVVESWTKLWTIRVGPKQHWPMEIWYGGLVMTCSCEDRLLWCDLSNSPQILQTLPDFASPSCSWRVTTKVVAFEKTRASLNSDRTKLTLQAAKRRLRS